MRIWFEGRCREGEIEIENEEMNSERKGRAGSAGERFEEEEWRESYVAIQLEKEEEEKV